MRESRLNWVEEEGGVVCLDTCRLSFFFPSYPFPRHFFFPLRPRSQKFCAFYIPPPLSGPFIPLTSSRTADALVRRRKEDTLFSLSPPPLLPLPPPQKGEGNEIEFPRACRVTQRRSAYTNTHSPRNSSSDEIVRKVDQIWGKGRRSNCFIPFDLVRSMSHNKFFQFSCHQH